MKRQQTTSETAAGAAMLTLMATGAAFGGAAWLAAEIVGLALLVLASQWKRPQLVPIRVRVEKHVLKRRVES